MAVSNHRFCQTVLVDVMPLLSRSLATLETSRRLLEASWQAPNTIFEITTRSREAVEKSRRLLASVQAPISFER